MQNITIRRLERSEVPDVWQIERREIVEEIYRVIDGVLQLQPAFFDTRDWPDGEPALYTPLLEDCFDHGGVFWGVFSDTKLIAAAVVEARPVADYPQLRQLAFLHVSHHWRGKGLAVLLYQLCMETACNMGAEGLYISSTSTRRTVEFYMHQGGQVTSQPDKALFALEPEDIHLIHILKE